MFRKPIFWFALFAASLGSIYFAVRYFPRAFPIVTLDLHMNRQAAMASAAELATRFQFPPAGYRQVASFAGDQEVQTFVELEGGGTVALRTMMAQGLYHPYKWNVRHFKVGETRETTLRFTPRGDPYGFLVKLPEKEPGAALEADRARMIAEQSAGRDWRIDLSKFRLVEQSREVRPGGRIDHAFVYERPDIRVGEGRYRLRLVAGGDKLTELTHFVKVPEAFSRRYEQMRSSNNVIGVAGTITFVVLYIISGCGVGLFFLLRQNWLLWRKPLLWGVFIALLQLLAGINQWPLLWMTYDTAISSQGFVVQQILLLLGGFLVYALLFTVSFMAAENLSRRAFPHHIQQWKLWSADIAGSKAVLGRTAGGYLLVGVFFAYDVLLYFVATRTLGWWIPSDVLVQPDVLSTYFPWLTCIAVPAQAGFWEESLFRAVPIAGAALLGNRFGRRNWWIAGAMIVQALVFGSGHAAYATQPFYARVAELIIPSFMFGGLYICFGLLPGIVLHFALDAVWYALPLFVSTAPGIWVDRILATALVLVPLWVVLGGRWRARRWVEVPDELLNQVWQPAQEATHEVVAEKPVSESLNPVVRRFLPVAGVLCLVLWVSAASFNPDAPPLTISRHEGMTIASQELENRGVHVPGSWKVLTAADSQPGQEDRFIWQTAGKESYRRLMHEYLAPPHWEIRFAQFEGDVAERAEEYRMSISDARRVYRFRHILPEARAGNSIPENAARSLAYEAMKKDFRLDPAAVKEVSGVPSKLKARTDWVFTFSAEGEGKLRQGERRIGIWISGDTVSDAWRFVHVPEEWDRHERDRHTIPAVIRAGCSVIIGLIVIAGMVAAIVSWSRKRYAVSSFLWLFALLLGLHLVSLLNSIPAISVQFSTAQPYKIQMFMLLGVGLIGIVLLSASLALIAGLVHKWCLDDAPLRTGLGWVAGLSLGGLAAVIFALGPLLGPSTAPRWMDPGFLNSYVPLLESVVSPVAGYFTQSIIALLILAVVNRTTNHWSRRKMLCGLPLFLFGFIVAGSRSVETIPSWLLAGFIFGCLLIVSYSLVLRFSPALSLIAVGVLQILSALKQGIVARPVALPGAVVAAIFIALATWFWYSRLAAASKRVP
jgi:hypothetical protein